MSRHAVAANEVTGESVCVGAAKVNCTMGRKMIDLDAKASIGQGLVT